ncbi:unnamed protein product [Diabrotica balteata]|uniref:Uncharacterized protein n=1 Tax=Diabrotica balteata TaxID=107213 RepID=A0A9N9XGA2_DIABA|nr:unnamed protein product [Diabrotica balteata]
MIGNRETITVMDGVQFVKTPGGEQDGAPRAISSDDTIESVIFNRITSFLGSHTLKIDLKGSEVVNAVQSTARSLNDYAESLEEEENLIEGASESRKRKGGKKGKGQMGALMGLMGLKAAILGKLALASIALIAGKALLIGKIALVLSAIIGLKKLLGSGGGGGKHVTYEVVPHASHSSAHVSTHETAYAGGSGHGGGYGGDIGGGYGGGGSGGWGRSLDAQSLAYRGHPQAKQARGSTRNRNNEIKIEQPEPINLEPLRLADIKVKNLLDLLSCISEYNRPFYQNLQKSNYIDTDIISVLDTNEEDKV